MTPEPGGTEALPAADSPAGKVEIDLALLLPEAGGPRPARRERLVEALTRMRGVDRVHVEDEGATGRLCLHYDPAIVTLPAVERAAGRAGAEIASRYRHDQIAISGMDCSDCTLAIDHAVKRLPGVLVAVTNYPNVTLSVEYDSEKVDRQGIESRIRAMGYQVPYGPVRTFVQERRELIFSTLAGALTLAGWLAERFGWFEGVAATPLFLTACFFGGFDISRHAIQSLVQRRFNTDLLMVVAALGAIALGEYVEAAVLLFLFSLGHSLEEMATDRARDAIRKLGSLSPKTALVRRDGAAQEVPVEAIAIGEVVIVRPGVRLPVDGTVLVGASSVDQAPVTGESVPLDKTVGDKVFAGTVNGEGALEVTVTRLSKDNTLSRVMQMVQEAQGQKTRTQQSTERFTRWFVPAVLGGALLLILVPPLFGVPLRDAFLRAMTLLVAASPCALALGAPSAMLAGVAQAARRGVLVKGGVHLEMLGAIDAIAFDKTGTLTHGRPELTRVVLAEGGKLDEGRLLATAAAVETHSGHPLAPAVVRAAATRGLDLPETGPVESLTGRGLRSEVNGERVLIGNRKLMTSEGLMLSTAFEATLRGLEMEGRTTAIVAIGSEVCGALAMADTPRADARAAILRLKEQGIKRMFLLSGDNSRVAAALARSLGISDVRAELMPEDKVKAIRDLGSGMTVAMVGDGVNDAPALSTAAVGIAMGGAGTDVALETADVALMADDLSRLPFVVGLGRATRAIVRQNLAVAIGVIAVLTVSSVAGFTGISSAIVLHEGSTLVVALNSLRLLRFEDIRLDRLRA